MSEPLISVVIPCYNSSRHLQEAVRSVLDQSLQSFELLLCDDGSTDNTWEIICELRKIDPRIVGMQNQCNSGISITRNRLNKAARGAFVAFLDCDDLMYPDRLQLQWEFLRDHPDIDIVGSMYQEFNSKRLTKKSHIQFTHKNIIKAFYYMCPVPNPTLMARKNVFEKLHFNEELKSAEDLDFLLRANELGIKLANLPYVTTMYRIHENSISSSKKFDMQISTYLALKWHYHRISKRVPRFPLSKEEINNKFNSSLYIKYSSARNLSISDQLKCFIVAPFSQIGRFFLLRKLKKLFTIFPRFSF